MKISLEKYNDLDFLKEVANNKEKLREVALSDNGFIFRSLKNNDIFPKKEFVKNVPSVAAIAFLFNHYDVAESEKSHYSMFFADSSKIMEFVNNNNGIAKETVIQILSSNKKQFTAPTYFLNLNDFIENEEQFIVADMNKDKVTYMLNSLNSLSDEDVLKIPDAYFKKFQKIYKFKIDVLLNSTHHRKLLESFCNRASVDVVSAHMKKTGTINAISWLNNVDQNDFTLTKLLNIAKESNPNITSNDFFNYLDLPGKYVVLSDFAGDLDSVYFSKRYMNNISLLREELEYSVDYSKLPVSLRNFVKFHEILSKNRHEMKYTNDILDEFSLYVDGSLSKGISLKDISDLPWVLEDILSQYKMSEVKNTHVPILDKDKVFNLITNVYTKLFADENLKSSFIPNDLREFIAEHIPESFNKNYAILNSCNAKDALYKKTLKKIPKELLSELKNLLAGEAIDLNSPLLKKSIFKLDEEDGKEVITQRLNSIFPDKHIEKMLNEGVPLSKNLFKKDLLDFYSTEKYEGWKLKIIKEYKKFPENEYLQKFVDEIKKNHVDAIEIFGSTTNTNKVLSNILVAISNVQEFAKENPSYYRKVINGFSDYDYEETPTDRAWDKMRNALEKAKKELRLVSKEDIEALVNTLKPKNYLDAKLIYETFSMDDKIKNIIVSSLNSGDASIIGVDKNIITEVKENLWGKLTDEGKELFFKNAIGKVSDSSFYSLLELVNLKYPRTSLDKELKEYLIKNHSTDILSDKDGVEKIWPYDIKGLKDMFEAIAAKGDWNFRRVTNTRFFDLVQLALENSSDDLIFSTLEKAKENPAVYVMLQNPIAFNNVMSERSNYSGSGKLETKFQKKFEEFEKRFFKENPDMEFEEDYKKEMVRKRVSTYRFFYDQLDKDVFVKGVSLIVSSFAKGMANDFQKNSYSTRGLDDSWVVTYFPQLTYLYNSQYDSNLTGVELKKSLNMLPDDIVDLTNKLLENDVGNVHMLLRYSFVKNLMGIDNFIKKVVDNVKTTDDINKVLLGDLSTCEYIDNRGETYFSNQSCVLVDKGSYLNGTSDDPGVYPQIIEGVVRENYENAKYVSYQLDLNDIMKSSFTGSGKLCTIGNLGEISKIAQFCNLNIREFTDSLEHKLKLDKKISDILPSEDYIDNSMNTGFKL